MSSAGVRTRAGVELLGEPVLGTRHAVAQSLGAVAPIFAIGFFAYLVAAAGGAITPLVVLISLASTLCLGWTFTLYARRFAGAGGFYEYIANVWGPTVGVFLMGVAVVGGLVVIGAVHAPLGLLIQQVGVGFGLDPTWWAGGLAVAALVAVLQYRSVRVAVNVQLVLTALAALPLLALAGVIIATGGKSGHTLAVFDPSNPDGGDLFRALLLAMLLFGGYESAAALGEESRRPHRSIPRAMLLTIVITGGFYLVASYAAVIGFGPDRVAEAWGGSPAGLAQLAIEVLGQPVAALMFLGIVIDLAVSLMAAATFFSRGIFALARDGMLPAGLAARSRHNTPVAAIAVCFGAAVFGLVAAAPMQDHGQLFAILVTGAPVAVAFTVIVVAIGGLRLLRAGRGPIWGWPVVIAGMAVPVLGIYHSLNPLPEGPLRWGLLLPLIQVVLAAVWTGYLRAKRTHRVRRATAYVLTPEAAEPAVP